MNEDDYPLTLPEKRSMDLLTSIVEANEWLEYKHRSNLIVTMFVQGQSGRWYAIEAKRNDAIIGFNAQPWSLNVRGGARKRDVIYNNKYCPNLCLNPHRTAEMPVGDKIAALCLSLHNDRITAMSIPLLAQFIVAPREHLGKVMVFQDEMVVLHSMMHDDEHFGMVDLTEEEEAAFNQQEPEDMYQDWEMHFMGIEDDIVAPPEPAEPRGSEALSLIDLPAPTAEEIAEQRMWEEYEQHMHSLAMEAFWNQQDPGNED